MQLEIIGSGSQGNSYLLSNDTDVLLIELGVQFKRIKKALDYDLSKINGALVSHIHGDHAKAIKDAIAKIKMFGKSKKKLPKLLEQL